MGEQEPTVTSVSLTPQEQQLQQLQINGNELVCRSWLLRRSRTTLLWKKLWFVLRRNGQLAIYKDEDEYKPLNIINLKEDGITVSKIIKQKQSAGKEKEKDKFQFALFSPKNKTVHLRALNEYDFNNWFLNLEKLLQGANEIDHKNDGHEGNNISGAALASPQSPERINTKAQVYPSIQAQHIDSSTDNVPLGDNLSSIPADSEDNVAAFTGGESLARPSSFSQHNLSSFSAAASNHSDAENMTNDDDYFTSDNEAPPGSSNFVLDSNFAIQEENEEEILKEEQELAEEQSSKNKMDLERIRNSESPDFMKEYLIQHYSYNSGKPEHIIQKGYLLRLKNLNQWKKFFIIFTNRHLIFYKIHNYSDTKNIDYDNLIKELAENQDLSKQPSTLLVDPDAGAQEEHEKLVIRQLKRIAVYPTKVIDLKNLVDVVELDPLSKSKQNCLLIITPTKRYRFCTKTETELVNWLILFKSFLIVRKKELEFQKNKSSNDVKSF